MFFRSIAPAAAKALSLQKDVIFRLLVIMTALLGWVAGTGAAGVFTLENIYQAWQKNQTSQVSVYLLSGSEEDAVTGLTQELKSLDGVTAVKKLKREELLEILNPHFDNAESFPLPVVLDVRVTDEVDRPFLEERVFKNFPTAEIEDTRTLVAAVGRSVRFAQLGGIILSTVIFTIMAMLVILTVSAGLRGQKNNLAILQYIGSTDAFLTELVVRQVLLRSLIGWAAAVILSLISLATVAAFWAESLPHLSAAVWLSAVAAPLILPAVTFIAAAITARMVLKTV